MDKVQIWYKCLTLALKRVKLIYKCQGLGNRCFFSFKGGWFFGGESKINYFWKMYVLSTGQIASKFQQASLVFIHKNKLCVMQTCLYMEIQCLDHLHSNPVQSVLFCDSTSGQLTQSPVPLALCGVVTHSQFCFLRHWHVEFYVQKELREAWQSVQDG